jgi:MFS family permease
MQLVANIWMYIGGRFIASVGNGIFGSASPRYIEECSPPHRLSFLYTIGSFGMSLNRPLVTLCSMFLPASNDPAILKET